MHPLLFNIGSLPIHTYGFLIAVGFLCAVLVIRKLCMMSGLDVEKTLDFTFWLLLVGFLGARILFIITKWDTFMETLPICIAFGREAWFSWEDRSPVFLLRFGT
jgi:phosphatidylglycerol:prolipoprotein diacylglycerol transferase